MLNRARHVLKPLSPLFGAVTSRIASRQIEPAAPDTTFAPETRPARLEDSLSIPICDQSPDDSACRAAQQRGQFLARQDRWEDLAAEITAADRDRVKTPGGMPVAELLAWGGRSDVIQAVEHALQEDGSDDDAPLVEGIRGLEAVRNDLKDEPAIALIVALAHIDIGWAWRGSSWDGVPPELNRERCAAHFDRAAALLQPLCGIELNSPAIAAAHCALLAGQRDPKSRIANDYEDLIDLDPTNHRPMRALGNHMLPRWFGSYSELELEARRTAARTQDIWGAGGYAWVCLDAIAIDDAACARVDVEFFIDGLRDIVARRPEQEMINLLAAYCAVALRNGIGLNPEADRPRTRIAECAKWLIRDHLSELHPLIWAHAADGFDNNARVTSASRFAARGRSDGLRIIAEQFRDDIERGLRVTITPDGPELERV